ncbi:MAG TPA: hypothetical protein VH277_20580 [Gemmatimonadaceae bacterium]|nr:hypothetical protein [Gemmatimonadaceae bacterium]
MHFGRRQVKTREASTDGPGELRRQIAELEADLAAARGKRTHVRLTAAAAEQRAMNAIHAGNERAARDALMEQQSYAEEAAGLEADIRVVSALLAECYEFLGGLSCSSAAADRDPQRPA